MKQRKSRASITSLVSQAPAPKDVRNIICVSDIHAGCRFGLYPTNQQVILDGGVQYIPSRLQSVMWEWWNEFWTVVVPDFTKGEPFAVVLNGDVMDGRHHNSVTQISQNLADQQKIAEAIIQPIPEISGCKALFIVRGTEAHCGQSAENEERLAKAVGAKPDGNGHYSRNELWMNVGRGLVHFSHHIGTTGSNAYETTALCKEYAEACIEAARWGMQRPDVVCRSHRHRHAETRVPTKDGYGICCVTPGWQLRTPFAFKIPGGRQSLPQFGGSLIRCGDEDVFTRHWVKSITRDKPEVVYV